MKKVCMIGTGYVGLVTGACLAELGNKVICIDKDRNKIEALNRGEIPIYEPGIDELVAKNKRNGRIRFSTDIKEGVSFAEVIFICVNTPPLPDGGADLSFVEACSREVYRYANSYKLLVEKSTVPVQTGEKISKTLASIGTRKQVVEVASNPEFLREGSAVQDFLHPDRIVIGVQSSKAEVILRDLYKKIKAPMLVTDIKSAELIKHASNSFLAMKISYINAIAQLCDRVGADVSLVAEGMGYDRRIGRAFLYPGIGYGGSCFPKDVSAFIKIAEKNGYDFQLLKATEQVNNQQRLIVAKKCEDLLWTLKAKKIGVLGLSFKPDTDDLRNAPAIDILQYLLEAGAEVKAYDPVSMNKMKQQFSQVQYMTSAYKVAEDVDALLILTEWTEFKKLNLSKIKKIMNGNIVVDGRNIFDPRKMASLGFSYHSIGRPRVDA